MIRLLDSRFLFAETRIWDGKDSAGRRVGMSIGPEVAVRELVGITHDDVYLVCHGRDQNLRHGVFAGRNM